MRFIFPLLCLLLTGCAISGSTMMIGTANDPIPIEEVTVLMQYPPDYSTIAYIECKREVEYWIADEIQMCFKDIKKRAAEIGANGLVLTFPLSEGSDCALAVPGGYAYPIGYMMYWVYNSYWEMSAVAISYSK